MTDPHNEYQDPPSWMIRLLTWFCAPTFMEEIEGDLNELFQDELTVYGPAKARRRFFFTSMKYLQPYFWGNKVISHILQYHKSMFIHNLTISFRHLRKDRFYSLINIGGLSIGIACSLLIFLYIYQQKTYDTQFPHSDHIHRIILEKYTQHEATGKYAFSPPPLAEAMRSWPEVEKTMRMTPVGGFAGDNLVKIAKGAQNFYEKGFIYADTNFFQFFPLTFIYGSPSDALTDPRSIVLTQTKADKLFPHQNPLGKSLFLNNQETTPFRVSAVVEDLPVNTHLDVDYLLSMKGLDASYASNWGMQNYYTYVILSRSTDFDKLTVKMLDLLESQESFSFSKEEIEAGNHYSYIFQPLTDIHLHSWDIVELWHHGDIRYISILGAIAFFILLIACINFINLSTARAANRAKEVGIRKVLGSFRTQLINQFLTESFLFTLISLSVALLLIIFSLPYINQLAGESLSIPWDNLSFLPIILSFFIALGLAAGIYPSLVLSSFNPMRNLQGSWSRGGKSSPFRSGLVVFQFTISIALIFGSLMVSRQIHYLQHKKLGYEKEQVVILEGSRSIQHQSQAFKDQLHAIPEISSVSFSSFLPVDGYMKNNATHWLEGNKTKDTEVPLAKWFVDFDYVKTLGMNIIEGRDFSSEFPTDSQAAIINKKAVELLNLEHPIGERISSYTYMDPETGELVAHTYTIIGVIDDFHFESLKSEIGGICLVYGDGAASTILKVTSEQMSSVIIKVKEIWASFVSDQPLRYTFLDERYAGMYAFEATLSKIFWGLTFIAVLIGSLGLFALATYLAEQRGAEMGIRKVLGASTEQIVLLLTKNFLWLIFISLLISIPIGWYAVHRWLEGFAYRIPIEGSAFVLAGAIAFIIGILTVIYQALRVAWTDPTEVLRNE